MDEIWKGVLTIFGGVVTLSIISVVISRKSQTPQVLQAASAVLDNVVAAAVNPVQTAATNSNPNASAFSMPNVQGFGQWLGAYGGSN